MGNNTGEDRKISRAEQILKIKFDHRRLLKQALTHPSYVADSGKEETYERLEFLGDAVLNLVIADFLFR
ncbi:MAG: ribonuclease III, partial [Terriglobia bacterium]